LNITHKIKLFFKTKQNDQLIKKTYSIEKYFIKRATLKFYQICISETANFTKHFFYKQLIQTTNVNS